MHQVNMAIPSEFLVIIPFTNSIPPIWQATNNNLSCVYTETLEINYELLYFNFYNSTENSRCCDVIYGGGSNNLSLVYVLLKPVQ